MDKKRPSIHMYNRRTVSNGSNPTKSSVSRYNFQFKIYNCIGEKYILKKILVGNSHKKIE